MNKRLVLFAVTGVALVALIGMFVALGKKQPNAAEARVSGMSAQELYEDATSLEDKNELLQAKETYQKIMSDYPDFKDMTSAQKKLEALNMRIIFSGMETPKTVLHEVQSGDSLAKIAKKYNTTIEFIKRSNNLPNDIIRVGQKLRIWQGVFSVYVDKSQNILILKCDGEVVKIYNVSTGKNNITPVGTFKIVNKLVNPPWFKSGAIVPPESPDNVLGTRWMGFDIPGYGIHGTVEPQTIGQQVTAGCVRMRNEEVEELYSLLPVGTEVTVVD